MIRFIDNDPDAGSTNFLRPAAGGPTTAVSLENIHETSHETPLGSGASSPELTVYDDDDSEDAAFMLSHLVSDGYQSVLQGESSDFSNFSFALGAEPAPDVDFASQAKQFFILSSAGKPIFSYHGTDETVTSYMGVIQTLVAFFQDDKDNDNGDNLRTITTSNRTKFSVLNQSPLLFMAVSSQNEPDGVLSRQLAFLHNFLLSIFSRSFIARSFTRANFNLQNHLSSNDVRALIEICDGFAHRTMTNLNFLTSSLEYFYLKKAVRARIDDVFLSLRALKLGDETDSNNLLYGLLVAPHGKLISILRPRNRSLHTIDLQILFRAVFSLARDGLGDSQEEFWVPICLPKFNANGFLYAYVRFVDSVALILLSATKGAFYEMKQYANSFVAKLELPKIMGSLAQSLQLARNGITAAFVHNTNILHFVYISKKHLQHINSRLPDDEVIRNNVARFYHVLKDFLDTQDSSQTEKGDETRIVFRKWRTGERYLVGFGLANASFEIYALVPHSFGNGNVRKDLIFHNIMGIVRWCARNEERLFVVGGAVF
ncbi:hypothetical protein BABINDRAFT_9587 [Babjeviella inositovora NRRL Y-12698]|uniref:Vacuolar fusion protein MON1 n=1 Tax=Babjeviella inositovora NRRL Y-12698 TaxID=984486 RepID=A0A1E3QKJ3_9ASCO|nr:uncharacterized protein BABINDRAFT_9587 [Babjeviella inositovora NRRL Y-12698]ODQ77974.1 hypothetical protein BABINDRAFT_9587 [Babjeviella inositovora NRRL Y-12698]